MSELREIKAIVRTDSVVLPRWKGTHPWLDTIPEATERRLQSAG